MNLIHDHRLTYTSQLNGREGFCRVRLFEADGPGERDPVVILTEPPQGTDPGPSVTNAAETIVAAVVRRHSLPFSHTVFIQHHARGHAERLAGIPETFDLLTFELDVPAGVIHAAGRLPDQLRNLPLDRPAVETLIGGRL